jgi:hypothetical protein
LAKWVFLQREASNVRIAVIILFVMGALAFIPVIIGVIKDFIAWLFWITVSTACLLITAGALVAGIYTYTVE